MTLCYENNCFFRKNLWLKKSSLSLQRFKSNPQEQTITKMDEPGSSCSLRNITESKALAED